MRAAAPDGAQAHLGVFWDQQDLCLQIQYGGVARRTRASLLEKVLWTEFLQEWGSGHQAAGAEVQAPEDGQQSGVISWLGRVPAWW